MNPPIFPGAHRAPTRRLVRSRPLVRVRMSSSRRWRVSRQASPFLSLPLPIAHVRIRRSNFCLIFSFLCHTSFTNGSVYPGYRCGFSAQFEPVTLFSLGKIPPFRWGSPDSSKQRRQGFCSTTGTFLPPAERSNRGSTSSRKSNEVSSAATSSFQRGTAA